MSLTGKLYWSIETTLNCRRRIINEGILFRLSFHEFVFLFEERRKEIPWNNLQFRIFFEIIIHSRRWNVKIKLNFKFHVLIIGWMKVLVVVQFVTRVRKIKICHWYGWEKIYRKKFTCLNSRWSLLRIMKVAALLWKMQESGYRNILFLNTSRESFFSQEFIPSTILNPEEKSLLMSLATSSKRTFLSSFLSTSDIKGKFYFWITAHEFLFSLIKRNFYRKVNNNC